MKLTWKFDSLGDWPALVETNSQCHFYVQRGFRHNAHVDLEAFIASSASCYLFCLLCCIFDNRILYTVLHQSQPHVVCQLYRQTYCPIEKIADAFIRDVSSQICVVISRCQSNLFFGKKYVQWKVRGRRNESHRTMWMLVYLVPSKFK